MGEIPVFSGDRIHWLWSEPGGEAYRHWAVFLSEELFESFGQFSVHFEEPPVAMDTPAQALQQVKRIPPASLTPETGPIELPPRITNLLEKQSLSTNEWRRTVIPAELRERLRSGSIDDIFMTITASTTQIAPKSPHVHHEEALRSNNSHLSNQPADPEYSGPLFGYAINKRSEESDEEILLERRAPINVAWATNLGLSPVDVSSEMKRHSWKGKHNLSPEKRYVIVKQTSGPTLSNLDDDAGKAKGAPMKQWHCRLYNIPGSMDQHHSVAGQAHKDPKDHNLLQQYLRSVNWAFSQSRTKVGTDWDSWGYTKITEYIGNEASFTSSNGNLEQIS